MDKQRTIKNSAELKGVGLHTGQKVRIEFKPACDNAGIFFVRKDLADDVTIKADCYSVVQPNRFPRRTSVGNNEVFVHTIEHLMAALNLLNLDNIQINIWGEEIPGMDGSAQPFIDVLKKAEIVEQNAPRRYFKVKEPLWVESNGSSLAIFPDDKLRVSYTLKYDNPLISTAYIDLIVNGNPDKSLYAARTFCLEEEIKPLEEMGLGKGSNYDNTLVVAKDKIIDNDLRVSDEFVKHKVIDLLGDLYLAGPFQGHVFAVKSGHNLNIQMVNKLRQQYERTSVGRIISPQPFVPEKTELSIEDIMRILPHRYPFLLIDRVVELEPRKRAVGIKNVTMNDYFFKGHFPGRPVMPGVLIVEAMAQVGGVLMLSCTENMGKIAYFMAADKIRFRKTVVPGDQLVLQVEAGRIKTKTGTIYTKALVDGKVVTEATLMFALVD